MLFNVGNFMDEMLVSLYGVGKFYNFKSREDLVGELVVALAPHTSAGIVGRITDSRRHRDSMRILCFMQQQEETVTGMKHL